MSRLARLGVGGLSAIAVALVFALWLGPEARADRMAPLPLEVRVAAADYVIVGKMESFTPVPEKTARHPWAPDTFARIEVERVLRGDLKDKSITIAFQHNPRYAMFHPEVGGRFVLLLRAPLSGTTRFGLVDDWDGGFDATKTEVARTERIAGAAAGSWHTNPGGLRLLLTAARTEYKKGENIDLMLLIQNMGAEPARTSRDHWPRKTMSRTSFHITGPGGAVAAKPVPIAESDISDYFEDRAPWTSTISPGRFMHLFLQRVNTAESGWGYKEELGFTYYPMKPGTHTVTATLHNYVVGSPSLESGPLKITIK